jgi:hypothetical protein
MSRKFDETVAKIRERLQQGRVILTERIRAGRRRQISVGPYRTAVGPRQYALCAFPALPSHADCREYRSADRAAREFVRLVGVDEAREALLRESRKRYG